MKKEVHIKEKPREPYSRLVLILLLVLSILDIVQSLLPSPAPAAGSQSTSVPAAQLYGNFLLHLPWGRYNIGIFDLLLMTAMTEYLAQARQ